MNQNFVRNFLAALIAVFSLSLVATAQATQFADQAAAASSTAVLAQASPTSPSTFDGVKIGNFGQMDERFYRGAQPLESDYQSLKDLGIDTVIDLRNDPTAYEKGAVEALGMKYVNIPMSGWKSPKQADVDAFLALTKNPDTGKFYVHCKAGIHRTGVVGAAYRYTNYGWDYDTVYKEMKNYNYSNGLVHGSLGSFVKKWGARIADQKSQTATASAAAATTSVAHGVKQ